MLLRRKSLLTGVFATLALGSGNLLASSHMDAPLITFDSAANTTDVYAFVDQDGGQKSLVVALGVYPFEEPGVGPNKYAFDDEVLYQIHLSLGSDLAAGRPTISYKFKFDTQFQNERTILQAYTGVIQNVDLQNPDPAQNLVQTYRVVKVDRRASDDAQRTVLGRGIVPPNNQGIATPFYNQDDFGEGPAKPGVASETELDRYTRQAIAELDRGYRAFAGQRDDGFYGDIQAIFDLLQLRSPGRDAQGGYNLHLMALEIPLAELGGDQQVVGVYATTSRRKVTILNKGASAKARLTEGPWVQVARQGNPLFNEALVAIADKDLYSRTSPQRDRELFSQYAETPELAALLNALVVPGSGLDPAPETGRSDIAAIFIPDLIKVDLSTPGVRFAGGGADDPLNPDDEGFSRLSVFGLDVLQSQIQDPFGLGGLVPGGWPNGRRFGDDVVDIAISAVLSDLRPFPLDFDLIQVAGDNVDANDMAYNKVFPYESTPQNGRRHAHHGDNTP